MKNTFVLVGAKFFEKGIMFLFFILFAKVFGKGVFGEFSYYFTIASVLFVIFDVGGNFYQIREFSVVEKLVNFNTIFILKNFIFILTIIITLIFSQNIYLLLLLISFYLDSIISIFRSSLYNNHKFIVEAKYTILEKVIFILLVLFNLFSIKNIILIYFSFLFSKFFYLLFCTKKYYSIKYIMSFKKLFDIDFAKNYLLNSWSYVLHALLVVVFVQIDIVMLKKMGVSFGKIGLYSAAVKIYMTIVIFADVLFKQYYPLIAKYINNKKSQKLKKLVLKVQSVNLFFSIYFMIFTVIFTREIIIFTFGKEFIESSVMLALLSIIIILRFSMYTYTAILSASNINYIKLFTSLTCVIVNIALNYMLIPLYGVYGAIYATIITEFLLTVMYKLSSLRIIFTNIITKQEIFVIFIALIFIFIHFNYDLSIISKSVISLLLIISLFIQRDSIRKKITF